MDNENIKILRNKISVPLSKALKLLQKNNGDVELSEQDFHSGNITEISEKAECDYATAKRNYEICNYDITKAIEKINQIQVIITTGKVIDSKIGFILWPENAEGKFYKTVKRNDAFIPAKDFDIILNVFDSVFPLNDLQGNFEQVGFDITGHNFFDHKTCRQIIEKINRIESNDESVKSFLVKVINWLNDKLTYADYIVVYGNL